MDPAACFVCGESVNDAEIYLSVGKTRYSKTTYPTKISQLIGDDFMVVVSKEDKVCLRCATLINRFDKLEKDLLEIKTLITGFLSEKYSLSAGGSLEYASEELEYSKEMELLEHKDALEVSSSRTKESVSLFIGCEQSSTLPCKTDKVKNNPNFKILSAHEQNHYCTSVKSETFCGDGWTDQSLETTTDINFTHNLNNDLIECKELSANLSVTESDPYSSVKLPTFPPVCKSSTAISTFEKDHTVLREVKKENDSLDHSKFTTLHVEQTKTVVENLKFENVPDSMEFECGNINSHSDLPKSELSIKSSLSNSDKVVSVDELYYNSGLLNTEEKNAPLNVLAGKTKHVINIITNHKKKLRPILPKPNIYLLESQLTHFDHMKRNVLEDFRNKKLKSCKSKQDGLDNKCSQDVPLYKENSKRVHTNNIKEETIQDKVSADHCSRLGEKEFENVPMHKPHVKPHSKVGMSYSCCFCSKTFKSKSGLYNHTSTTHTKNFRFCCEICGQGFTNQSSLAEHHSRHTKEHLHVCDICGKKFNSRGTYWIHRKWHFDPLPYRCTVCNQLFKHSSLLSVHKRRKHTGERPYKCPYCILTFNVSGTFKRHLILHTKNYPFICDICKLGFTTRFKYSEHMAKAHSVFIDQPNIEKKDYKVAVYDDETEDASVIANISVSDSLVTDLSRDLDQTQPCIPKSTTNNIVEIVLEPSNTLTEHIITLPGNWLM